MGDLLDTSARLLDGDLPVDDRHPFRPSGAFEEVTDGIGFVDALANVVAVATDDGLLLVDTGSVFFAHHVHRQIRAWTDLPLHTAVYTHGHIDHVFGTALFEEERAEQGLGPARVVAHEAVPARFDRYVRTAGYNAAINRRQFQAPGLDWPVEYRYPDETYRTTMAVEVGAVTAELHHARGETDDHTWVWLPHRRVLCTGDLVIWCFPNAGNPQKAQRYPDEWAAALRTMAELEAEVLLPGHGLPVAGASRVRSVLVDTADALDAIVHQVLDAMNAGARLDDVLHEVRVPEHLRDRPYLQPVYDDPEFVARNVWRLYGGWYDGNPARLQPPADARLAAEVAALAGGPAVLHERAVALSTTGDDADLRLAGQLVEWAVQAAPDDTAAHRARAEVAAARHDHERSLMARGVYASARDEATTRATSSEPE